MVQFAAVRSDDTQTAMQKVKLLSYKAQTKVRFDDALPSDGQHVGSQKGLFGSCSGRAGRQ